MPDNNVFDIIVSHSAADKAAAHQLADRLRSDGLTVGLDELTLNPDLLVSSNRAPEARVNLVFLSTATTSSDTTQQMSIVATLLRETGQDRHFVSLLLNDVSLPESIAHLPSINWHSLDKDSEYRKLLEICWSQLVQEQQDSQRHFVEGLLRRSQPIRSVAISPDGTLAITGSEDKSARVWDMESLRCLRSRDGHTGNVLCAAWSPDSRSAITGSMDNNLRLWDVESGECVRAFQGHTGYVYCVALLQGSEHVLSGSLDNTVRLWDLQSGQCLQVLIGHTKYVYSVAWSPDGNSALSGACDHTIRWWNVQSGECTRILEGHTENVVSVTWMPNGRHALSGSFDGTLRKWDVPSGECLQVFRGHTDRVYCIALSPESERVLSGAADRTIRLWETESGKCLRVFEGHTGWVYSLAWTPDGKRFLSTGSDSTLQLWDIDSGCCLHIVPRGHDTSLPVRLPWNPAVSPEVDWQPQDGVFNEPTQIPRRADHSNDKVRLGNNPSAPRITSPAPRGEIQPSLPRKQSAHVFDLQKCLRVFEGHAGAVTKMIWSSDGQRALSADASGTVRVWSVESGTCLRSFPGHQGYIASIAWSPDGRRALCVGQDSRMFLSDVESGTVLRTLDGHSDDVYSAQWSPDGERALSGGADHTMRLWNVSEARCMRIFEGHSGIVYCVAWSPDGTRALSGASDATMRLWDVATGECLAVLLGHSSVTCLAWSPDRRHVVSGSGDRTVRLWDMDTCKCVRISEGHTERITAVTWTRRGERFLSAAEDCTARLWECGSGKCLHVFTAGTILSMALSPDGSRILCGYRDGAMRLWNFFEANSASADHLSDEVQVQYTNAKVVIVGDSGVGKTGLSRRLVWDSWQPTDSTDGVWATHWLLQHDTSTAGVDREIWLWDFAGQIDYRLVHQLFMDDAATALLVFDPRDKDPFDGLGQWDRDLQRISRSSVSKLLVAARIDCGGLIVDPARIQKFMDERGFTMPLNMTSAKTGGGCEALRGAIIDAIDWKQLPETTSPTLFRRMKQIILDLREAGLVLIRLQELKERIQQALGDTITISEIETVLDLLAGPGMVMRLSFGGFVLLCPEILSRYAASIVRKLQREPQGLGCIREDDLLSGNLEYNFKRLPSDDEAVVIRVLLEAFVGRAWCVRQTLDESVMLAFPSYFRREREEQTNHPSVLVTYTFDGPVDEIYATLVVKIHHTGLFDNSEFWNRAADFRLPSGTALGFKLVREAEGKARLEVYFAPEVDLDSKVQFLRYVQNHLMRHAQNVVRIRHYLCSNTECKAYGRQVNDQVAIDEELAVGGSGVVHCPRCAKTIELIDEIELQFESEAVKERARVLENGVQVAIDNESRELMAVHHTGFIVAEAGQIYRGYTNSDHGIDGEIEFKDGQGNASGRRLYVQLKSGDSYLSRRQRDQADVFQIKNARWAKYWQQQAYPVMLVIRTSDGLIRWMDVSAYLKEKGSGEKLLKQVVFSGERLDVESILRWREKVLRPI